MNYNFCIDIWGDGDDSVCFKRDLVSELEHMRLTEANWKEMKLRLTDLKN